MLRVSEPVNALAAASQQTREDLLEAGLRLLLELPASAVFAHLTAARITAAAGRTSGAFFHQWPSMEAYLQDFVAYVLRPQLAVNLLATVDRLRAELAQGQTFADAVVTSSADVPRQTARDPQTVVQVLAWNRALRDQKFRDMVAPHYEALDAGTAEIYADLTALLAREPRPPFTPAMMGALLDAIAQGLAVRTTLTPDLYPDELFGWVTMALIPLLTRDPGDDRDADAFVHDLPLQARTPDDSPPSGGRRTVEPAAPAPTLD
jgi:AcrR family transcriptional regulator